MEPVKITDGKEWSCIDIFLFSNGQQYSPPRKYHLRSEELQWWGTTLSYLGRTHYGSGHSSIELYAIDGTEIKSPLELVNGAAYVAVEPPDSFINTGYEEYLLRATRSWEKRLAQKSYNNESSGGKEPTVQNNTSDVNKHENIPDTELSKIGSNAITTPQKSRPNKPYLQRKSIANSKQIQKKKSLGTPGSTSKKMCVETDKIYSCPNKTSSKKNEFTSRIPSTVVHRKLKEITNDDPSSCNKKNLSLKTELNPKTEDSYLHDKAPVRESQIIDFYKDDENSFMLLKNEQERSPLITDALDHQEQNILPKNNIPMLDNSKTDNNQQNVQNHASEYLKLINEYEESNRLSTNEKKSDHQENTEIIHNIKENRSYEYVLNGSSEKQIIDEYVAHMNKGGLLLLKLKVKLKDCKTIFNKGKSKNVPLEASLPDMPKTEKTSQVDINISFSGELFKSNHELNTQDKSLQSLLNKLCTEDTDHTNTKNPRIIILQCACHNNPDNYKYCKCETFDSEAVGSKFETMFNEKLKEIFTRCECHNDVFKTSKEDSVIRNGVKLQSALNNNEDKPSLPEDHGRHVKDLAQIFESSDTKKLPDNKTASSSKLNSINSSRLENREQSIVVTRLNGSPVLAEATNQIKKVSNSKSTHDKSTQTDWCNILLEARRHENDNYSFHLPPLYILKQCNL